MHFTLRFSVRKVFCRLFVGTKVERNKTMDGKKSQATSNERLTKLLSDANKKYKKHYFININS